MTTTTATPSAAVLVALRTAVDRRAESPEWRERDRALAALGALVLDDPVAPALDHLAAVRELFGLAPLDELLLLVGLLAEVHPSAHLLCGLLSGDGVPARPTVALALELVGASVVDVAARDRVAADGLLVRHGLLALEGDDVLLARRLRVPDRVVARLLGSHQVAADAAAVLIDAEPVDLDGYEEVTSALRAGEPLVWVHSPVGAAGTALAVAACREVGVTCLVADLDRLPIVPGLGPDTALVRRTVQALVLEAGLGGMVLVLAGAHLASDLLGDLRAAVPVVAVGRTGWDPRWSVPLPPAVMAARLSQGQRA
ncbi:MAG TPA: hypothetical protein VMV41_15255, partial [Cellulomonadaceae bacterium]|nr:hypothetical protein [Cellulomonadaceae bacterium]